MSKKNKIIIWIIIGVFAIIFLPDVSLYYQRLKLKFDTLPKVYKSYQTIDRIKDDYYEVVKIVSAFSEPFLQINDSTIVIMSTYNTEAKDGSSIKKSVWYKINPHGKITDSLKYEYNERKKCHFYGTYHGYIVDTKNNTYNTWLINSDTTTKYFRNLKENKVFTAKEVGYIVKEKEFMNAERISSDEDKQEAKYKLIVYKDKVWNYLYTDKDWYESATYSTNNLAVKYKSSTAEIDKNPYIIKRVFVKKEEWISRSFWHLDFGWGGGYKGDRWEGISYFEVTMPKKNLHFKQPVEINSADGYYRDQFTYNIYKPKNGDYLLLTDIENSRYYLIMPKVKM